MPTFVHSKLTVVKLNAVDVSNLTKTTSFEDSTATHDTTTYGNARKVYSSGLGDGKITIGGTSATGVTGSRAIMKPLKAAGEPVPFVFQPHGVGAGKEQSTVDVLITSYNESSPVDDMVQWTAELQMTGDLDETAQV